MIEATTELEAVNEMLEAIGETPVDTLDTDTVVDAAIARDLLRRVSRSVQTVGWSFNTDENFKLQPDSNGEIKYPATAIRIDGWGNDKYLRIVRRNGKLYDKTRHSSKFERTIYTEIVWLYDFEDLPEPFRIYIALKAARRLHDRLLGSEQNHRFTQEDELEARAQMVGHEINQEDLNMLSGSHTARRVLRRGYPPSLS